MIRMKSVSFQYANSAEGVFEIDLTIADGECVVLTGPGSAFIVGKKRNITSKPRITAVGIWMRDINADSSPGGVVIRSQPTRNTADRFQNIST